MNFEKGISMVSRLFFLGAFALMLLAVVEKFANFSGYTILRGTYEAGRLLEFAVVLLVFVIAIQLREMKLERRGRSS
jgi:hypothetical protein